MALSRPGSPGDDRRLQAFALAGDITAEAWVKSLLQDGLPAQAYGRLLLKPGAKAPLTLAPRGKQVCSCFDVGEPAILQVLEGCRGTAEQRVARLQAQLRCGTNCGSCLPELKRLARAAELAA